MEIDTGASISIIRSNNLQCNHSTVKHFNFRDDRYFLKKNTQVKQSRSMETTSLNAGMATSLETLTIQVVAGDGPDLMGRDMLSHSDIINLG